VYANAKPKQVEGAFINGKALVKLAECYTDAINTGAVPTIHSAWQSVVRYTTTMTDYRQHHYHHFMTIIVWEICA
jgi:hypothetical protein